MKNVTPTRLVVLLWHHGDSS